MTMIDAKALCKPLVHVRDGAVFANSRDVADFFGKQHAHVLRDIDNLLKEMPNPKLDAALFIECTYHDANGQPRRCIEMTRDGFSLLAMGFTGAKALSFKLRYIEQFNAMEAELRKPAVQQIDLANPDHLLPLLASYAEDKKRLAAQIEAQAPKEEAFDRIADADGSMCITDAAKHLQIKPKALFDYLDRNGWTYRRPGTSARLGYQARVQSGLLSHKVVTVQRDDGTDKIVESVRITAKGIAKLAETFSLEVTKGCG